METELTLSGAGVVGDSVIKGWSVTEDATPVAPGDSSGGTGQVSVAVEQGVDSEFVFNNQAVFSNSELGNIKGRVVGLSSKGATEATDSVLGLTIGSKLTDSNSVRTLPPISDYSFVEDFVVSQPTPARQYVTNVASSIWNPIPNSMAVVSSSNIQPSPVSYLSFVSPTGKALAGIFHTPAPPPYVFTDRINLGTTRKRQYAFGPSGDLYFINPATNTWGKHVYTAGLGYLVNTTSYGSAGTGNGQFTNMKGIAVDSNENVYIVDANRVQKFAGTTGTYTAQVGSLGSATGQFNDPRGITIVSGSNNVYVADYGNKRVQRFTSALVYGAQRVFTDIYIPVDLDFGANTVSVLAVTADGTANALYTMDTSGLALSTAWVESTTSSGINIKRNADGTLYVTGTPSVADRPTTRSYVTSKNTLSSVIRIYLMSLPGYDGAALAAADDDVYSYQASTDPVVAAPGWKDNVWNKLKELCAAYNIEIVSIDGIAIVRDVGSLTTDLDNAISGATSLSLSSNQTARNFTSSYTGAVTGTGTVFYDALLDSKTLTVDVGVTTVYTIQIPHQPTYLVQPVKNATSTTLTSGQYFVSDSAGVAVSNADWVAYGGSVRVGLNPNDPNAIDVTITGPTRGIPGTANTYELAYVTDTKTVPAFSVLGIGLMMTPGKINIITGASDKNAPNENGGDVNNIFMESPARVFNRGVWRSSQLNGPSFSLSSSVPSQQFDSFGRVAGTIVDFKESKYRTTSSSISTAKTSLTLDRHVTVKNFAELNPVTLLYTNLAKNPEPASTAGFVMDNSGGGSWSAATMAGGRVRFTNLTATSSNSRFRVNPFTADIVTGDDFYVVVQVRTSIASTVRARMNMNVNADGTGGSAVVDGSDVAIGALVSTDISASGTATASTLSVTPVVRAANNFAPGDYIEFRRILVKKGTTAVTYFSGATTPGGGLVYSWLGTPGSSYSTQSTGRTVSELTALWAGNTVEDFKIKPLRPLA